MKRCPRDTFALRVAGCSLCPLALRQGPLTPPSSRQVARLPHDEPPQERERRFLSPRSPTRWDPGSGEKPGPTLEGERGGAAWGGGGRKGEAKSGIRPLSTSGETLRRASGVGPRDSSSVTVAGQRSGGCSRSRDIWGQTKAQWGLRPRRLTVTLSAPGWGQLRGFLPLLPSATAPSARRAVSSSAREPSERRAAATAPGSLRVRT